MPFRARPLARLQAMSTAYISHPACLKHDMGAGHPECPARLQAIETRLRAEGLFDQLHLYAAQRALRAQLLRVHAQSHIEAIEAASPREGLALLDADTALCPHSLDAAYHAAGGGILGVDKVMAREVRNAFVACRPPGHHATRSRAMGFCLFNNVAVATAHALEAHGLKRVAIVDFDVHHGNGTEDIFNDDPRVMLVSTFQHPFYPGCGADTSSDHVINIPLPAHTAGEAYRKDFQAKALPKLDDFAPEMIFFSAGFDGHRDDEMSQFALLEADYAWITAQVMVIAERHAQDRIVSLLEGGYELGALGRCAARHIRMLAGL